MAEDTWYSQEKVWLERIDIANREGRDWTPHELFSEDEATRQAALTDWDALIDEGLIHVQADQRAWGGRIVAIRGVRLTGKGRRAIGRWPDDGSRAVDELLGRLEEMINVAAPEQRSRLVQARDSLLGIGRDVLVEVMGQAAAKSMGT